MRRICRNLFLWALSVTAAIPATAVKECGFGAALNTIRDIKATNLFLSFQPAARLRGCPMVRVGLARQQKPGTAAMLAMLSAPASSPPDMEVLSFAEQGEKSEPDAGGRDRKQAKRGR